MVTQRTPLSGYQKDTEQLKMMTQKDRSLGSDDDDDDDDYYYEFMVFQ